MALGQFLFGNKDQFKTMPTVSGQQGAFLNSLLSQLMGMQGAGGTYGQSQDYLSQMLSGSPEAYERFAAPHQTHFNEKILPGIAERFSGLGGGLGGGAGSSSGFGQALGGAASQYGSNLAGLYAQLQQQAAQQAMGQYGNLSQLGLGTRTFENMYRPGSTGAVGGLLSGIGQGVGSGLGMPLGNSLLSQFGNLFGGGQSQGNYNSNDQLNWFR